MSDRFADDLRDLLDSRARVGPDDLEPLRRRVAQLPPRRRRRRGWLVAAAGILLALGLGGVLVSRLPLASIGTAPATPSAAPTAQAGEVAVGSPSAEAGSPTAGPSAVVGPSLPPQLDPAECAALSFAPDRCLAIVEQARSQAGPWLDWAAIAAVDLTAPVPDGVIRLGGGRTIADVTFRLADGSTVVEHVGCAGIGQQYNIVCTDHPEIPVYAPYGPGAGYHDVPCGPVPGGKPGPACATPLPSTNPAAAKRAVPLEIAARDIPITATGHLEIDVGSATLPNGVLSDARFSLADPSTRTFTVANGITLEVRSQDPSRPPFTNAYQHGWYPGTEDVEVYLVLDVTWYTPGAQLQIRDLVVR